MCIRDRRPLEVVGVDRHLGVGEVDLEGDPALTHVGQGSGCLLYTSDAADERSSVDLGGSRIIKKKKKKKRIEKKNTHTERDMK